MSADDDDETTITIPKSVILFIGCVIWVVGLIVGCAIPATMDTFFKPGPTDQEIHEAVTQIKQHFNTVNATLYANEEGDIRSEVEVESVKAEESDKDKDYTVYLTSEVNKRWSTVHLHLVDRDAAFAFKPGEKYQMRVVFIPIRGKL